MDCFPRTPPTRPVLLCSDPSAGSERFGATEVKNLLLRLTLVFGMADGVQPASRHLRLATTLSVCDSTEPASSH
ncbi:hypothetical protein ACIBO5_59285 [Nonomuraea angiospora]|uniref:hypothetical protein n=1 Tax=Nonomuraea angiospora TaxID=46172 RepID=UPI0029A031DA|nr:hypothetical protein [Nonomuraea angiospora]MDX3100326.1 hypothetical protein [Nonomuraea angiospora]